MTASDLHIAGFNRRLPEGWIAKRARNNTCSILVGSVDPEVRLCVLVTAAGYAPSGSQDRHEVAVCATTAAELSASGFAAFIDAGGVYSDTSFDHWDPMIEYVVNGCATRWTDQMP